ncbi:MAG: YifB family Mg chelatase-like AAA ATPase [Myxococcales bacterium]|nr:YifB family Mg chelatase-like AAA ATPase [Myxococcales bacterium]
MLATAHASTLIGLETYPVSVEVDVARGLPSFDLVGLAEAAVRESRTRVRAAVEQSGFHFPLRRVTVNLAPADVKKSGTGFDLAIAVAMLAAAGEFDAEPLAEWLLLGELSLTGTLRGVRGVLPQVLAARDRGLRGVIVAPDNAAEAAVVEGVEVKTAESLREVCGFLQGFSALPSVPHTVPAPPPEHDDAGLDLRDVRGQEQAKRALEIAAAGGHNLLLAGPPGGGKTMLARTLPGLLPPMEFNEALEATAVHSVAGILKPGLALLPRRPFRAPHHTASAMGLVGGGDPPRPGEVALAHHGVLFLDELPEFSRESLEGLREPLEEGHITIVRARSRASYPARFMLVAAMNPCPCGYAGDPSDRCDCAEDRVKRYRGRVSGPLLDRIDLHVQLPPVRVAQLSEPSHGPSSAEVRARVSLARQRQVARQGDTNASLSTRAVRERASLDARSARLLSDAADRLGLSARAIHRVLKVSRTIADLAEATDVGPQHLAEAIAYRAPGNG